MSSSGVNLENYLIPLEEINRATENFIHQRCIGGGGFGLVYKGQLSERWQNRTAAIKRLGRDSCQGEREFRNELEMISRFHHENIISFIGYCDEGNEMIIVYDYATNGSLDHHLQHPSKMCCITWIQRLKICIGAARGLNYLHSGLGEHNRVIHRDIKSSNILLDENLVAKICDFGLSKVGPRNQPDTQLYTRVAGTQFYLDPTYHESRILRKESDVYSFGIVMFEILSGMLVYRENNEQQLLMTSVRRYYKKEPQKVIDPHIRDQIDSGSFDAFQKIAYQCISFNLSERPTMDKVIDWIEEALSIQTYKHSASTPPIHSVIETSLRKLCSVSPEDQRDAAAEICFLAKRNHDHRVAIAKAGIIPLITQLLTSPDSQTQEHAVTAIRNLSFFEDNKSSIVSAGAIPGIIHVLKEGNIKARGKAAATLFSLSLIDENKITIGFDGAIPPLLLLLNEGTQRGKKDATNALAYLCIYRGNKIMAVRAGIVPVLLEFIRDPHGVLKDGILVILALLSTHPEGAMAIGKAEAVDVIVEVIKSGSRRMKENATGVLGDLCSKNQKYLMEAEKLGVMENLMDLLHNGTDRGKRKARRMLEMMTRLAEQQKLLAKA